MNTVNGDEFDTELRDETENNFVSDDDKNRSNSGLQNNLQAHEFDPMRYIVRTNSEMEAVTSDSVGSE